MPNIERPPLPGGHVAHIDLVNGPQMLAAFGPTAWAHIGHAVFDRVSQRLAGARIAWRGTSRISVEWHNGLMQQSRRGGTDRGGLLEALVMELSGAHAACRGVYSLAALSARWIGHHGDDDDGQGPAQDDGEPFVPARAELAGQRDIDGVSSIHEAMREGRVRAVLQPVCDARSPDQVFYYECLARVIARDTGASVAHQPLLASLERLGLTRAFDRDMVQRAIRLLAQDAELVLGVNVSAGSAVDDAWWDSTFAQLAASPLVARRLILEITESARPMQGHCRRFAAKLRHLGCRVGVDDFGAGYSEDTADALGTSDFVKIAGPLLTGARHSARGMAELRRVIGAAREHARLLIVEHVEDEQALRIARRVGAQFVQGFHVGQPIELATLFRGR